MANKYCDGHSLLAIKTYIDSFVGDASINADFQGTLKYSGKTDNLALPVKSQMELNRVSANAYQFNQLVQNGNFAVSSGWNGNLGTVSIASNKCTFTITTSNTGNYINKIDGINVISGHIYLCTATVTTSKTTSCAFYLGSRTSSINVSANTRTFITSIKQADSSSTLFAVYCNTGGNMSAGDTCIYENIQVFDLTAMGLDTLTTEEQVEAEFNKRGKTIYAYNEYNTGSLINTNITSLDVTGVNLWDEEWDVGSISNVTGEDISGSYLRSKNLIRVIPNDTYYLKRPSDTTIWLYAYDINGNFLPSFNNGSGYTGITAGNYTFTMPSDVYFVRFLISTNYGTTYNNDICINISDASINGQYFPYEKTSYPINFSGKSAGNVHDYIEKNGIIHRLVGSYTFTGSESWSAYSSGFEATLLTDKEYKSVGGSETPTNVITDTSLIIGTRNQVANGDSVISLSGNKIFVGSTTGLTGKTIYYELATPTTEQGDPLPIPTVYMDGSETQIFTGCPATINENYDISIKDQVITNVEVDKRQEEEIQNIIQVLRTLPRIYVHVINIELTNDLTGYDIIVSATLFLDSPTQITTMAEFITALNSSFTFNMSSMVGNYLPATGYGYQEDNTIVGVTTANSTTLVCIFSPTSAVQIPLNDISTLALRDTVIDGGINI